MSRTRKKYPLGSCGKILFKTIEEANTRAFYLNNIASNHNNPMRYYICTKCRGYHLTSKPFVSPDDYARRKKEVCVGCEHPRPDHTVDGMCWAGKNTRSPESLCPCTRFSAASVGV